MGNCDVLLVFVNDIEKQAVFDAFVERYDKKPGFDFGKPFTYHDFGNIGGALVLGRQIQMGSITRGGSATSITVACMEKNPRYIILVGVAFGMEPKKQGIGDILVSEKLSLYEVRKIGKKNGKDFEIIRGDTTSAPEGILGRFKALSGKDYWEGAPVRFELLLSGEKLIDNPDFKKKLQKEYPEAAGGEMEAAGAYAAAELFKKDWIVVKGVCDYADGDKGKNKKQRQKKAAANAAQLVFHVLEKGQFGRFVQPGKVVREKGEDKREAGGRARIKERIKRNILRLLAFKKMDWLVKALNRRLNQEFDEDKKYKTGEIVDLLLSMDVLDAVLILDMSVKECMEDIRDAAAVGEGEVIDVTWNTGVSILGWLVLLGVDDRWVETAGQYLMEMGDSTELAIPVKTEAGADIAFSRLKQAHARLKLDEKTKKVVAKHGMVCDGPKVEEGWDPSDNVRMIKTALWTQLIRIVLSRDVAFTPEMDAELNQTLRARHKKGEPHYIAVNLSCENNPLLERDVFPALKKDLPDLEIVVLGSKEQGGVAIIGEPELHAQLREFFRNKP